MKLLDRYILRQFTTTFVMLVLGLPLLFIIGDVTDNIDKYMDRGLAMSTLALGYVYQFPLYMVYAFPIAALVATVFTIGGMTRHQEITAAKAGGVSFYRLFLPIGAMGVVLSGVALVLTDVVPITLQIRAELMGETETVGRGPRLGFVFQTEREGVLSARRLDPRSGEMSGLVLERKAARDEPGMHRVAQRAVWSPDGAGWRLEQGWIRELGADGTEVVTQFDTLGLPGLVETPDELLAEGNMRSGETERMRYEEISRFIQAIERSGGDASSLKVDRAQKIAIPMAVMVIVLFGAPLVTSSNRGGAAYGVGISLGITIIYMLMFRVARALGGGGAIEPVLAAWSPNLLFLAAAIVLLSRVRT
jgi:lipopolysaccharide export system permease protein